ncbi:hypothetical protein AXF42_Ash016865 [Apostasia shenzhenica]|uniref:Protein tolB n=1 Tax=Apostasia shenzhenica TaxID=1088818 RepID=A0A2I0BAK5_9ASPA|nr:hypothetical protein AXF42_Ash016865 [Apostasia shenzhenica]
MGLYPNSRTLFHFDQSISAVRLMEPCGTIAFSTVGLPEYGFDVFSTLLPAEPAADLTERRHTDGASVNFNAQFADAGGDGVTFVSERTGSARLYMVGPIHGKPKPLPTNPDSLFHDRPTVKNRRLFYVSAHEPPPEPFKSWSAVYLTRLDTEETVRLTPTGVVDFSPAVSESGELVAVASYGSRPWKGDFRDLETEIIVFRVSDPSRRTVVSGRGGWPSFAGNSTIFFHRKAEDGWWSIYRIDLPENLDNLAGEEDNARRITPPGVHALTPAAAHDGKRIGVATRRKGKNFRHIELFDLESERFEPITERLNPNLHHYNPFFSPDSARLGYHRFRGESDERVPHLQPVISPVANLRMIRYNGTFASFSPDSEFIAINGDFNKSPGLMILRSDGSRRWTVLKSPAMFYTSWSPAEKGVIFTSIGPIFESSKTTVEIARVSFDPSDLTADRDEIAADLKILTRSSAGNNAFPSCSPDGKHIVFRSGRSGQKNLYILDAINGEQSSGGGIRRLTEGDWVDTMPSWSPDGELIAFSSNRHNPTNPEAFSIFLVRPDGSDLRRVHVVGPPGSSDVDRERINHVCFSPDSKWLLFTANLASVSAETVSMPNQFQPYGDLWTCRLDGTRLTRLTCNAYENGTPAWHGDCGVPDIGSLSLVSNVGEKLRGPRDEPLWLTCDV